MPKLDVPIMNRVIYGIVGSMRSPQGRRNAPFAPSSWPGDTNGAHCEAPPCRCGSAERDPQRCRLDKLRTEGHPFPRVNDLGGAWDPKTTYSLAQPWRWVQETNLIRTLPCAKGARGRLTRHAPG